VRSRRSWWVAYGVCAAVVLVVLGWVTGLVLSLERAEIRARTEAAHQESLRLALWRMDSWLAPWLAQEAARPYFDYEPFYPQQRAYSTLLAPIEPGEVLMPSPLLSFQSDKVSLHFQVGPDGRVTSPQAPAEGLRDLAEQNRLPAERITANAAELDEVASMVTRDELAQCVDAAEHQEEAGAVTVAVAPPGEAQSKSGMSQRARDLQEAGKRQMLREQSAQQAEQVQQWAAANEAPAGVTVTVGSLVPLWVDGSDGGRRLIFTRRVQVGSTSYFQGFLCDWPRLRQSLLEQISDLFADAQLVPVPGAAEVAGGMMLATIPAALRVPPPVAATAGLLSPARLTLALTWLAVLGTLAAVAVTLQASVAFGEKRSRFASAVTHELRTPLTTFRMYSEMLAEGMVADPDQRQVYLETLRDESGRLSGLVENVLAYARLEEGRAPARPAPTTLGAALDHVTAHLRQRAEASGMSLDVAIDAPRDTPLETDTEVVGQILGNLVDNACKYAAEAEDHVIRLHARAEDATVALRVSDRGPGVGARHAKAIFNPFDRGERGRGDAMPGVGLGLALARGLARDLGGDLVLEASGAQGACFKLTLPITPR
jgi:signal transduction histidine kinase